jgi:hypothetical protein
VSTAAGPLFGVRRSTRRAEAAEALRVLNRVLHVHRLAAPDPHVRELVRDAALARVLRLLEAALGSRTSVARD